MRYEDRWAQCWPNTVPSVRHVEVLAQKNAWRAEALDRRYREKAALEHHSADDHGQCPTCRVAHPCATYWALTTTTPWHRSTAGQPVRLPLTQDDVRAALDELLPDLAPAAETKPKLPRRKAG